MDCLESIRYFFCRCYKKKQKKKTPCIDLDASTCGKDTLLIIDV